MFCLIFSLFSFNKYKNTGSVQTCTAPSATTYKLEVWGAQGGDSKHTNDSGKGGKGGYAIGTNSLSKSTSLYIYVGQSGNDAGIKAAFNGGGNAYYSGITLDYAQGGGCTHIASVSGLLSTLSSKKSSVLIVAGAGGGYENNSTGSNVGNGGGYGGGLTGGNGGYYNGTGYNVTTAKGGTENSGGSAALINGAVTSTFNAKAGSFGKGGDAFSSTSNNPGGAGGGGWYGGGGSPYAFGGGGGSSYIGGVKNGKTIAGNASMPKPTGGTETGHTGNGYCKITWMPVL